MTTINTLATFVTQTSFSSLSSETVETLKIHLLDTIGAMFAGSQTLEGRVTGEPISQLSSGGNVPVIGFPMKTSLLTAIMTSCAATRCTEIDDIHLGSCTTPGSVTVPTAISLAYAGYLVDPRDFLASLALGYELIIRLGVAIDGPNTLYQGIWPTYMATPLGSAAVTAKALKLNEKETADALACALTMSTGVAGRIRKTLSSRWLTLGVGAQNGVIAAFFAKKGFAGDDAFLDTEAVPMSPRVTNKNLVEGLGEKFLIDEVCIKPYPGARQALAAVEAFRELITAHEVDPDSVEKVIVFVPGQFTAMIDKPKAPENRLESLVSVQYQISLAALKPSYLMDVKREPLLWDRQISTLMSKIIVKPSLELETYFPKVWPARVEIRTKTETISHEVLYPKGDPENPFNWNDIAAKFKRLAGSEGRGSRAEQVVRLVRAIDTSTSLRPLLESL